MCAAGRRVLRLGLDLENENAYLRLSLILRFIFASPVPSEQELVHIGSHGVESRTKAKTGWGGEFKPLEVIRRDRSRNEARENGGIVRGGLVVIRRRWSTLRAVVLKGCHLSACSLKIQQQSTMLIQLPSCPTAVARNTLSLSHVRS